MNEAANPYRWAARFILLGLGVEALSLLGLHRPFGFLVFTLFGCTALILGIALFVIKALSRPTGAATGED